MFRKHWTPHEADEWTKEDLLACVFSSLSYILLMVGSALCFLREYGVTYLLRGSEPEIIAGIKAADAENDLPMSARGTRELITKCANLSLASPQLAAAPVDRAAFNESCSALAKSILDRNPSSSRTLAAKLVFMDALTTADYAAAQQSVRAELAFADLVKHLSDAR